jgi:hypothetical protein
MKMTFLSRHDARLARAGFERGTFECAEEKCAQAIVIYARAAASFKSIRQSEVG